MRYFLLAGRLPRTAVFIVLLGGRDAPAARAGQRKGSHGADYARGAGAFACAGFIIGHYGGGILRSLRGCVHRITLTFQFGAAVTP